MDIRHIKPQLLAILLAASLTSCIGYYRAPVAGSESASLRGDTLPSQDARDWAIVIRPEKVDGRLLGHRSGLHDRHKLASRWWQIEAGYREIVPQIDRKIGNYSSIDIDVLPPIQANMHSGRQYIITGNVIVGSAFKYWIEDTETDERITETSYYPAGLTEELRILEAPLKATSNYARLSFKGPSFFLTKTALKPGKDCFKIVAEKSSGGG